VNLGFSAPLPGRDSLPNQRPRVSGLVPNNHEDRPDPDYHGWTLPALPADLVSNANAVRGVLNFHAELLARNPTSED
jgi:hypothetical protein